MAFALRERQSAILVRTDAITQALRTRTGMGRQTQWARAHVLRAGARIPLLGTGKTDYLRLKEPALLPEVAT